MTALRPGGGAFGLQSSRQASSPLLRPLGPSVSRTSVIPHPASPSAPPPLPPGEEEEELAVDIVVTYVNGSLVEEQQLIGVIDTVLLLLTGSTTNDTTTGTTVVGGASRVQSPLLRNPSKERRQNERSSGMGDDGVEVENDEERRLLLLNAALSAKASLSIIDEVAIKSNKLLGRDIAAGRNQAAVAVQKMKFKYLLSQMESSRRRRKRGTERRHASKRVTDGSGWEKDDDYGIGEEGTTNTGHRMKNSKREWNLSAAKNKKQMRRSKMRGGGGLTERRRRRDTSNDEDGRRYRDWGELQLCLDSVSLCSSSSSLASNKGANAGVGATATFTTTRPRSNSSRPSSSSSSSSSHPPPPVLRRRNVYLVVKDESHVPSWLGSNNNKSTRSTMYDNIVIKVVYHRDLLLQSSPFSSENDNDDEESGGGGSSRCSSHPEVLTFRSFSSNAIESLLHRIPGLGRYFVYFNNDMLWGRPVSLFDYFQQKEEEEEQVEERRPPTKSKRRREGSQPAAAAGGGGGAADRKTYYRPNNYPHDDIERGGKGRSWQTTHFVESIDRKPLLFFGDDDGDDPRTPRRHHPPTITNSTMGTMGDVIRNTIGSSSDDVRKDEDKHHHTAATESLPSPQEVFQHYNSIYAMMMVRDMRMEKQEETTGLPHRHHQRRGAKEKEEEAKSWKQKKHNYYYSISFAHVPMVYDRDLLEKLFPLTSPAHQQQLPFYSHSSSSPRGRPDSKNMFIKKCTNGTRKKKEDEKEDNEDGSLHRRWWYKQLERTRFFSRRSVSRPESHIDHDGKYRSADVTHDSFVQEAQPGGDGEEEDEVLTMNVLGRQPADLWIPHLYLSYLLEHRSHTRMMKWREGNDEGQQELTPEDIEDELGFRSWKNVKRNKKITSNSHISSPVAHSVMNEMDPHHHHHHHDGKKGDDDEVDADYYYFAQIHNLDEAREVRTHFLRNDSSSSGKDGTEDFSSRRHREDGNVIDSTRDPLPRSPSSSSRKKKGAPLFITLNDDMEDYLANKGRRRGTQQVMQDMLNAVHGSMQASCAKKKKKLANE